MKNGTPREPTKQDGTGPANAAGPAGGRRLVIIAGGGTGGHIYPGLSVARALMDLGYRVEWVGAKGGLEEKIVSRFEIPLHRINIGKLHSSAGFFTRLRTLVGLPIAFCQALIMGIRLKPVAVLGVGGYASGPFLFIAVLLGKRTLIWEPNAHAGMANRLLAPMVDECLLVFDEAAGQLRSKKIHKVGLPVRDSIRPTSRPALSGRRLRVLVFGGSQGARPINRVVREAVETDGGWLEKVELVHQIGSNDFVELKAVYERLRHPSVSYFEYLHDMEARYAWADIVVCRAGASTVAEISAAGKAAVFVPLPSAADDHQTKNAQALERGGGALVIAQKDFTAEVFKRTILGFLERPEAIENLETKARQFAVADAARAIAERVIGKPVVGERALG